THPELSAQCYSWVDVSGFTHRNVEGVERALRDAAGQTPEGQWVFAFGLDPMLTAGLGTWDRHRLDAISPLNPMAVMIQSMHTLFVNSAALQAAGIDENTADPGGGGRFQRDSSGAPTGVVMEQPAMNVFMRFMFQSMDAWEGWLTEQYRRFRLAGITTLGVAGVFVPMPLMPLFEKATVAPDGVRAVAYRHFTRPETYAWTPATDPDRLRVQGVKLWYDGSPYSGTMLLDEPYLDSQLCCDTLGIAPGTRGHANVGKDELRAMLAGFRRRGWQVMTHTQGDRSTREVLDAYEEALRGIEDTDHRWRLEHCALITSEDMARARRLGVALSFHANHVYYYGPELRESILGPERAERLMPVGTAIRLGHRVSLHTDSPMYPPEPLRLMRTVVTRQTRTGEKLRASEAITAHEALRAVTIDAAWQLFAEERCGSIEVGKYADFAVLERNPLEVPPEELDTIAVTGTWLGGRPAE
ncbi:MAG TPA: amidohydrolase, partial [Dehalococcoidia bacterium]|nr:amidohydrolase [Dehalococcoidia bacterium]